MADRNQMVGPPDPQDYRPRRLEGRQEEVQPSVKDMYPMLLGQGSDLISTEDFLHSGNPTSDEKNPLPGMDHTLGRLGWGAAETLGIHHLLKHNPKLGKVAILGLTAIHGMLARQNSNMSNQDKTFYRNAKR